MLARKGRLKGRKPKLTTTQQTELPRGHGTGDYTITDLAELFTISDPPCTAPRSSGNCCCTTPPPITPRPCLHLGLHRESPSADAQYESGCSPLPRKLPWCPTSASVTSSSRAPGGGYRNAIAAERVEYAADRGELSPHLYDVAPRYFNRYLQARIRGQVAYGRLLPRSHGSSSHTTPPP